MQAESSNSSQIRRKPTNDVKWPSFACTSKKREFDFDSDPWSLCFALLRDIKSLTQNCIPQILWASLIPNLSAAEEANQCTPCNDAFPAGKGQLRIHVFTLTLPTGGISGPSKFRPWRRSDPQTAEYSLLPGDSTWCSITECLNHWRQERLCHSAVAGMASMHWVRLVSRQSRVWTAGTKIYLNSSIATFDLLPYISPCTYQSCCTYRDTPSRSSSEWQLLSLSHS